MEIPHAPLKDLRSTGYFFHELRDHPKSPDMDLTTYCTSLAVPYLVKTSESYDKLAQFDRTRILKLAIKHLESSNDTDIVDSIFGIRKVALSEIDKFDKPGPEEEIAKSITLANRRRLESAEFLVKLLVNIIRVFHLAEPVLKKKKDNEAGNPTFESIIESWEVLDQKSS
ncbi:MAG: hypothetical protein LLG06_20020 [Desulfobacteraceae bacterium]|nr:hypothetical protein [Desulfobacteraceae bacterium]